jgi:hypothetical protein
LPVSRRTRPQHQQRKLVDFIDHFVGGFFLDEASRLYLQKAGAVPHRLATL